jgi:hypothetical protein
MSCFSIATDKPQVIRRSWRSNAGKSQKYENDIYDKPLVTRKKTKDDMS